MLFRSRPYGRIRLNEPTVYDLHEIVIDAITHINAQITEAKAINANAKAIDQLERKRARIRNVRKSLALLAEEKGWNEL